MTSEIGQVCTLTRYPVKSMAGTAVDSAFLGWHGLEGDRRFAFRRVGDESGFPWLTASRLAELLLYHPLGVDEKTGEPTHVRTPAGRELELRSKELGREVAERLGSPVELMKLMNGIFDEAPVSMISLATIAGVAREAGVDLDRRRFRANIVLDTRGAEPFLEDGWVGGTLLFGDRAVGPAVSVTERDARCVMVNLDPETAAHDARVLKAAVRLNANNAGVYGTVVQTGRIAVGQPVSLVIDGRR
jgi:uncharacterized protein